MSKSHAECILWIWAGTDAVWAWSLQVGRSQSQEGCGWMSVQFLSSSFGCLSPPVVQKAMCPHQSPAEERWSGTPPLSRQSVPWKNPHVHSCQRYSLWKHYKVMRRVKWCIMDMYSTFHDGITVKFNLFDLIYLFSRTSTLLKLLQWTVMANSEREGRETFLRWGNKEQLLNTCYHMNTEHLFHY